MRRITLLATLTLTLLAARGSTQPAAGNAESSAVRLREQALHDTSAYAFVSDLTTLFGPRPAGSQSEAKAAEWCAQQMKAIGLANVRTETFPLAEWSRGVERAEIVGRGAQRLAVTALGGTSPTPEGGVEGEVVLFATLGELQAAPERSLAGKIALLNYQMPRMESGLGYNAAAPGRGEGPIEAAKRGAIAFVLRSAGTGSRRFPHTGATRFENGHVPIPAFALSAPDADQVARLAKFGPVRLRLASSGRLLPPGTSQNVIGEIAGSNANEILTIGAHLDSWDLGTGAIDDGAGVGIVLAAAKLLASQHVQPRRTIRFVIFGAEEVTQPDAPYFITGGNHHAQTHKSDVPRIVIASESDLGGGRILSLSLPAGFSTGAFATSAARVLLPLGIVLDGEPAPHGGADMFPLQTQGVPVFLLRQDASTYFDLHHTADDTLDKIDPEELRQNVAAWASLVWLLAESDVNFRAPAVRTIS